MLDPRPWSQTPAWLAIVALAATGAGCRKSPDAEALEQMAPHREKAAARIASLKKLAPTAVAAAPLTADAVAVEKAAVVIGEARTFQQLTAGLIYEEDLGDVESPHSKDLWPMPKSDLFGTCGALLKGGGFVSAHLRAQVLKNCAAARYAVVVRTLARVKPTVDEAAKRFTPGSQSGEVHVYDLETGQGLGGFHFSAKNDDSVRARGISDLHDVEQNIALTAESAIEAGLTAFAH